MQGVVGQRTEELYHLININSIGGTITTAHNADYSASKFALTAFTDALRQGIKSAVNTV
jgi:short-subunit dehydrogenase